ncbi:MAG: hypothetical protein HWD59_08235 [Coxiellaceae bacterium]|nr:MAG: hypothetical protein HWD59_08235 [Coxiellaceae bacterium]
MTHLKLSGPLLTEKSLQQVAYLPVLKWLEISHININKLKINPWLMPFSKDTFTQLNQLTIENCNSLETLEIMPPN